MILVFLTLAGCLGGMALIVWAMWRMIKWAMKP
jgi:hypothetical protein